MVKKDMGTIVHALPHSCGFAETRLAVESDETSRPPKASPVQMRPQYSDGVIGIRRFCQEDIIPLYEAVRESIRELSTWMTWCHPNYGLKDAVKFVDGSGSDWENGNQFSFAICEVRDGTLLGSVGLNQVNRAHNLANLGYWVRSGSTGRGIAPVATRMAARFAFDELNFSRLELLVPLGNNFSRRVAEKTGAKNEGILRSRLWLHGKLHAAFIYSLLSSDLDESLPVASKPAYARAAKSATRSVRAAHRSAVAR